MNPALVIAGPTASGKSGLALRMAKEFGGWVINADSMQVYGVMRVLTARPSAEDEATVPHRLYGVLPPTEICSAARWRDLAAIEIDAAWQAGAVPIIVGGTGLYLRTMMEGLSPIPAIPDEIRENARSLLVQMGNRAFHILLSQRDPVMGARLDPGNTQRLSRAWEVLEATGRSLADWQNEPGEGAIDARWQTIVLDPPRPTLNAACDGRFLNMIEHGALQEAREMAALNLNADFPAMKALGLPDLIAHLNGTVALDDAIASATKATRSYAKRQGTWFRHQISNAHTINEQFSESLDDKIFSFIRQFLLTSP
jgi:tRNA dimethylallyltransferase